jgi:hypothetical protein
MECPFMELIPALPALLEVTVVGLVSPLVATISRILTLDTHAFLNTPPAECNFTLSASAAAFVGVAINIVAGAALVEVVVP